MCFADVTLFQKEKKYILVCSGIKVGSAGEKFSRQLFYGSSATIVNSCVTQEFVERGKDKLPW